MRCDGSGSARSGASRCWRFSSNGPTTHWRRSASALVGGQRAATPGATAAAIAVAGAIVIVGFTIPEAALGHSLVGAHRLTFFGGERHRHAAVALRLPDGVTARALGPTPVRYRARAVDALGQTVPVQCLPASGATFPIGRTTVTCHAGAAHGSFVVNVVPIRIQRVPTLVVTPPPPAEATGPGGARVTYRVRAHERATTLRPSCHPASGSLFALGTTNVECSATDARRHRVDKHSPVVVRDTTAPNLRVPSTFVRDATSRGGAVIGYSATANDVVGGRIDPRAPSDSGATFPIGTTAVSCTAKDEQGRVAVRSFSVRVVDAPPTLKLPGEVTASAVDAAGARVAYTPPAAAVDRVDGKDAVSCLPLSGSQFALGASKVKCTTRDSSGNSVSGSFKMIVKDTTAPTLTVPTRPLTASAGVPFIFDESVQAVDNVDQSVAPSCSPASGTAFGTGSHTVECAAVDAAGNRANASFTVVATDHTSPVLTVPTSPVTAAIGSKFEYAKLVSAVDAVDGPVAPACTPAAGFIVSSGKQSVTCTATDAAGNVAHAAFTVVGKDLTPPVLIVPTTPVNITAGVPLSYGRLVSAKDAVDGAIKPICTPPSGSTFSAGTHTVVCTATDRAGNTSKATFTVIATVVR